MGTTTIEVPPHNELQTAENEFANIVITTLTQITESLNILNQNTAHLTRKVESLLNHQRGTAEFMTEVSKTLQALRNEIKDKNSTDSLTTGLPH